MAFTEDLSVFLSEADFAVSATLGAATFSVIFDRAYVENQAIGGTQPVCVGKTADLGSATHGTAITIAGTAYTVQDNQPDGTGMTTLVLQLA
jgi:hypothetical protein